MDKPSLQEKTDTNIKERQNRKKTINVFNSLRFIAFLLIFLCHADFWTGIKFNGSAFGVSFFIIISGFLNGIKYYDEHKEMKIKELLKRRVKKFYKLHIAMLIISVPLTGVFLISSLQKLIKWFINFFINAFLLQGYINKPEVYFGFNGVSWFLCLMVFLTLVTIPLLHIIDKIKKSNKGNLKLILMSIVICILEMLYGYLIYKNDLIVGYWAYILPIARLPEYFVGMIFGVLIINQKKKLKINYTCAETIAVIIIIIIMILYHIGKIPGYLNIGSIWTIPTIILLCVFINEKGLISRLLNNRVFIWLGKISMECFLTHQIIIKYFNSIVGNVKEPIVKYFALIFIFLLTIMISNYIYSATIKSNKIEEK